MQISQMVQPQEIAFDTSTSESTMKPQTQVLEQVSEMQPETGEFIDVEATRTLKPEDVEFSLDKVHVELTKEMQIVSQQIEPRRESVTQEMVLQTDEIVAPEEITFDMAKAGIQVKPQTLISEQVTEQKPETVTEEFTMEIGQNVEPQKINV